MTDARWLAPLVVTRDELEPVMDPAEIVRVVHDAYRDLATTSASSPSPMAFHLPDGDVHVKGGQLAPDQPVVVKVATGVRSNVEHGRPPGDGGMIVIDPVDGRIAAILLDGSLLTDLRTAAVTSVAVKACSPAPRQRLTIIGAGVQATLSLRFLAAAGLLPQDSRVWARRTSAADAIADQAQAAGLAVTAVTDLAESVSESDLVITTTPSHTPVLRGSWLQPHALVVAVGADSVGKRECDDDVLRRADQIVTDSIQQARYAGELQHASDIATPVEELSELLAEPRTHGPQLVLCDLTGLGAADAAIASYALRRLGHSPLRHPGQARGLGDIGSATEQDAE